MSVTEAEHLGIEYKNGQRGFVATANGTAPAYKIRLPDVRIGDVQVYDVEATVVPMNMPFVLLGNSFLTRFQMRRDNDTMTLSRRF
jgi:aspartyl protease family protein